MLCSRFPARELGREIARRLGIHKSRVGQIEQRAMEKLRRVAHEAAMVDA